MVQRAKLHSGEILEFGDDEDMDAGVKAHLAKRKAAETPPAQPPPAATPAPSYPALNVNM